MNTVIRDLYFEIKEFLFEPREITVSTNFFVILVSLGCIGYLIFGTLKYLTQNNRKHVDPPKDLYTKKERRWYPTGWVWNDKKKLWEPPDYVDKDE